jgi:hypothetical protein
MVIVVAIAIVFELILVLLECENTLVGKFVMVILVVIPIVFELVSDFQFQKRTIIFGIWNNKTKFPI